MSTVRIYAVLAFCLVAHLNTVSATTPAPEGADEDYANEDDGTDVDSADYDTPTSAGPSPAAAGGVEGQQQDEPTEFSCFICDSTGGDAEGSDKCSESIPQNCTCVPTLACTADSDIKGTEKMLCFKESQFVYDAATNPATEYTVTTRGCTKTKRSVGCHTEKTPAGERTSCLCEGDRCNGATGRWFDVSLICAALSAVVGLLKISV